MAQMQETMYSGFNVSFEALGRSITSIASSLGEVLLPFLMQALTWVQGLVTQFSAWFTGLSEGEQKILLIITAVVAAIGPLLIILGKLSTSVSSILHRSENHVRDSEYRKDFQFLREFDRRPPDCRRNRGRLLRSLPFFGTNASGSAIL